MSVNLACQSFLPLLSPFVDGELPSSARNDVERHLSACAPCTGRVADFRAESGLIRVGLEMIADELDLKDFSQRVMARLAPVRVPLMERMRVSAAEIFAYRKGALVGGFAMASLALLAGLGFSMRPKGPEGYAAPRMAVEAVSTDEQAHVAPVVMKTAQGTIIWLVNHEDKPVLGKSSDTSATPKEPPKGGEL